GVRMRTFCLCIFVGIVGIVAVHAQQKSRARDLGVPFDGVPGPLNAITDVAGVEVGMTTLISGEGPLKVGGGPVRTGVTAILPRGKNSKDPVFAGWFSLNGNGEMTGTTCYGFKCGSGTASRRIEAGVGGFTVGVLVQANHGARKLLRVAGVPVGQEIPQSAAARAADDAARQHDAIGELGSIIIVVG